ncbi:hypothetical protein RhiirA4_333715, partial [Rhizophagus irregularis]
RIQFPLQNTFALTVHKIQAITLPKVLLHLDDQMFAPGQTYVAISRCRSLDDEIILSLILDAFKADEKVKKEYIRLEEILNNKLPI